MTTLTPPFHCPTQPELRDACFAALPPGRAWGTHDGGPYPDREPVLWGFWSAVGGFFEYLYERACKLRLEFYCRTHDETHDLWMLEYGLPDACDPFPDLCSKVTSINGARCEDYAQVAATGGWEIDCRSILEECGTFAGNGVALAGRATTGGALPAGALIIHVNLSRSDAYQGALDVLPYAGIMQAGKPLACPPDITPLKCLMDRVVHADVQIRYTTSFDTP